MDIRANQEREELHKAIWGIADELRGSVDGWDFKNYVLGAMFYRYISENFAAFINDGEIEAGHPDFDYSKLADAITERTKVIIPVDLAGVVCDYDKIFAAVESLYRIFIRSNIHSLHY